MVTFLLSILVLVLGFVFYGRYVEKVFGPDDRKTAAYKSEDDIDYIPMPLWRVYLIQLLNIAGTGPIFGALSGAVFGPIVYLWIVFGCILAGGVHDYLCGMLSERENGASVSELVGKYLGKRMAGVMRVFSVVLLIMCGVVFTKGPADLLAMIMPNALNAKLWLLIVMAYYFIAVFVPIDKIIGKIYPLFAICLIFMALGVSGVMLLNPNFHMPELWNNFRNMHPSLPWWPFMLITVACGAISGFHATQSPLMARCIKNEKHGRKVFYGAMITEGIIALVWAAAGVTCYETREALQASGMSSSTVYDICMRTMGSTGGIIALLGVVICPISSGDTAYRSARLTIADWFKIDQSKWKNRILITILLLGTGLVISNLDYTIVWRYFSFSNQALATIVLWAETVYLSNEKKNYLITLIPAAFMTAVTTTYFLIAEECLKGLGISYVAGQRAGIGIAICILFGFLFYRINKRGLLKSLKTRIFHE